MEQQSLAFVLQHGQALPALPGAMGTLACADFVSDALGRGERYFWRTTARLSMLRRLAESPSPDLSRQQVLLCLGYAENLMGVALEGRSIIFDCLRETSKLKALLESLRAATQEPLPLQAQIGRQMALVHGALQCAVRATQFQTLVLEGQQRQPVARWLDSLRALAARASLRVSELGERLAKRRADSAHGDEQVLWTQADRRALDGAIELCRELLTLVAVEPVRNLGLPAGAFKSLREMSERLEASLREISLCEQGGMAAGAGKQVSGSAIEDAIDAVLLSVQAMVKHAAAASASEGITARAQAWRAGAHALGLSRTTGAVRALLTTIGEFAGSSRHEWEQAGVRVAPLVEQQMQLAWRWCVECVSEWGAACKFGYIFSGVLATLLQRGFCVHKDEEDDGRQDGELKFEDDVEGTGMGEGEGKKDVSKQIEDPEEQLLGTRDEKKEEGGNEPEEDDAIEMELDFEGTLHDFDEDKKKPQDEGGEEEEAEREMGEFEAEKEDVVDERLWDDPSDKEGEDDEAQQQQERFEKDNPLKMQEGMELEMAAKEGDDEAPNHGDEQDQEQPPADEKQQPDQPDDNPAEDGEERAEEEVVDKMGDVAQDEDFKVPSDEDGQQMEISSDVDGAVEGEEEQEVREPDEGQADGEGEDAAEQQQQEEEQPLQEPAAQQEEPELEAQSEEAAPKEGDSAKQQVS